MVLTAVTSGKLDITRVRARTHYVIHNFLQWRPHSRPYGCYGLCRPQERNSVFILAGRLHKPYEIIITTVRNQLELNAQSAHAQSAHALNLIITRVTVSKHKTKPVVKAVLEFLQYSTEVSYIH